LAKSATQWVTLTAAATMLCLALIPAEAQTISRYNPTSMSCGAIQAVIDAEGVVILRWVQPPNILRYDRFVAGNQYCGIEERVSASDVPSADQAKCQVYVCRRFEPRDFFFLFGPDETPQPRPR